jgi:hypothetical protein
MILRQARARREQAHEVAKGVAGGFFLFVEEEWCGCYAESAKAGGSVLAVINTTRDEKSRLLQERVESLADNRTRAGFWILLRQCVQFFQLFGPKADGIRRLNGVLRRAFHGSPRPQPSAVVELWYLARRATSL